MASVIRSAVCGVIATLYVGYRHNKFSQMKYEKSKWAEELESTFNKQAKELKGKVKQILPENRQSTNYDHSSFENLLSYVRCAFAQQDLYQIYDKSMKYTYVDAADYWLHGIQPKEELFKAIDKSELTEEDKKGLKFDPKGWNSEAAIQLLNYEVVKYYDEVQKNMLKRSRHLFDKLYRNQGSLIDMHKSSRQLSPKAYEIYSSSLYGNDGRYCHKNLNPVREQISIIDARVNSYVLEGCHSGRIISSPQDCKKCKEGLTDKILAAKEDHAKLLKMLDDEKNDIDQNIQNLAGQLDNPNYFKLLGKADANKTVKITAMALGNILDTYEAIVEPKFKDPRNF